MKPVYLVVFVLALSFLPNFAHAQNWNPANPINALIGINGVHFSTDQLGYAVGAAGAIYKSTDGGLTWTAQTSNTTQDLQDVFFVNATTGFAVGAAGTIRKTTDGGSTWSTQTATGMSSTTFNEVQFLDVSNGFIVGTGGAIIKTTNGGTTWSSVTSGTANEITALHFTSTTTGFFVSASGLIRKTTNGGTSFSTLTIGSTANFTDIFFVDANTGFVCGTGGEVWKTTNAGTTWTLKNSGVGGLTNTAISFFNGQNGTVTSTSGYYYVTIDGGDNWIGYQFPGFNTLFDVMYSSSNAGYIVGTWGMLAKYQPELEPQVQPSQLSFDEVYSTSMRVNYTESPDLPSGYIGIRKSGSLPTTDPLDGITYSVGQTLGDGTVAFIGAGTGFTQTGLTAGTSYYFKIYAYNGAGAAINYKSSAPLAGSRTTYASGTPWNTIVSGSFTYPSDVHFIDASVGGEAGTYNLQTTVDGGINWAEGFLGNGDAYGGIHFINATTAYTAGTGSNIRVIRRTVNGGATWVDQMRATSSFGFSDIWFTSATTGFVVGGGGNIYRTLNGINWSSVSSGVLMDLNGVHFPISTFGVAVGASGAIVRTSDGGATWSPVGSPTANDLNEVFFTSATTGYAVGAVGTILTTTNGGGTWVAQNSGVSADLRGVWFTDPITGYVVGNSGTILKTIDAGANWYPFALGADNTTDYYNVCFPTPYTGYVVGRSGVNSRTIKFQTVPEPTAQPTALAFSAINATGFVVTFTPPATPVDGYILLRKAGSAATATPADGRSYVAGEIVGDATVAYAGQTPSSTESGLLPGTNYYYSVYAYNFFADGASSNYLLTAPLLGSTTTLLAPPTVSAASPIAATSFTANWTAVPGATSYQVDVSPDNFASYVTGYNNFGAASNAASITGLTAGVTYAYRVRAVNVSGASVSSSSASVLTLPAAPVAAPATSVTTSSLTANWSASNSAISYVFDLSQNNFSSYVTGYNNAPVSGTSITINGLTAGTTYQYRVRAINGTGTSANSSTISTITIATAPAVSAATSVTASGFTAIWSSTIGAVDYRLDVASDPSFNFMVGSYSNQTVAATTLAVTGLGAGTSYYYRVRGSNASGSSANSSATSVLTLPSPPVSNDAASVGSATFSASWNAVATASSYLLDVSQDIAFSTFLAGYNALSVASTSATVTVPVEGLTYYYRVRAVNSSGNSAYSSVVTTLLKPAAPVASAATSVTSTSFRANWSAASGASGYTIEVSADNFVSNIPGYDNLTVAGTTLVVSGLLEGTTYKYRLRGTNALWSSVSSSAVSVTTIPPAPVALAATSVTNTGFTAKWSATAGAASYLLDVSLDNFTTFVAGFNGTSVAGLSAAVSGLSPGQTYQYRVRAVNSAGTSPSSAVITVAAKPDAPVASAATSITSSGFTASWSAVRGATDYRLDVSQSASFVTFEGVYSGLVVNGTTLAVSGLSAGITYHFRVRANNTSGASGNSNVIDILLKPAPPDALAGTAMSASSFTANWSPVSGIAEYRLDVSVNDFISNLTGHSNELVSGTSVNITGLSAGNTYKYRVRAVNATGASDNSSSIAVVTVPPAPVAVGASQVTTSGFTANWNTTAGVPAYYLDIATDNTFTNYLAGYQNLASSGSSQSITGLPAGTSYYYRVRGANVSGTSINSNVVSVATLPVAPGALAATAVSATGFTANWAAVSGITTYRLDISTDPNFSFYVGSYFNQLVNGTTLVVTGLSNGTQYFYRVRSENASGSSSSSSAITVLTWPAAPVANESLAVTGTTFLANWNSVSTATGYFIDVSSSAGFSTLLSGYDNMQVAGTSETVTVPSAGVSYYYRVRATSTAGLSANSNTVTTLMKPAPPVTNSPSGVTTTSFTASWLASAGATGYYFDVSNNNFATFVSPYENFLLAGTSLTVTGLTAGANYQYRVRSYNATGSSISSSVVTMTTVPPAPVTISASGFLATSFVANWQPTAGASSYELDVSEDPLFTNYINNFQALSVSGTSATVDNLTPGTVYYYRTRAVNSFGISAHSNVTSSTNIPPAPTGILVSAIGTGGFSLTWATTPGAFSYELDISADNFATYAAVYNNLSVTGTSLNITGLASGTLYQVRLRASNASGTSTNSAVVSAETLPDEPTAQPAQLVFANVTTTGFGLSYTAASGGATGYLVLRGQGSAPQEVPADGTSYNAGSTLGTSRVTYAGSATSFSETGLAAGQEYFYAIYAYSGTGSKTNYRSANPLVGSKITLPDAPSLASASAVGQHGFTINWTAVTGATNYSLDVSSDSFTNFVTGYQSQLTGLGTSYTITGLSGGAVYQYRLRALNASGISAVSAVQEQLTVPETPANLITADITASGFTVSWDATPGTEGYLVDVATDANFTILTVTDASAAIPSIVLTGLASATTYFVRVRAVNTTGKSASATAVSAKTLTGAGGPGLPVVGTPQFTGPLKSSPVTVTVAVTGGADPKSVEVYYRGIAGTTFAKLTATLKSGNTWEASLSPAMADTLGIEFYVKATDADGQTDESDAHSYLYRAIDAASNTAVPFATNAFDGRAATYQMFSIPYELADNSITNLFEPALVGYSNTRWRLMHYDNGALAEYPEQLKKIELGNGYWFNTIVKDFSIKLSEAQVKAVTPASPFTMSLKQGWNQIGDPYPFNVDWNAIVAANPNVGLNGLWLFEAGNFVRKDVLGAWKGAFVFSDNGGTLSFPLSSRTSAGGRTVPSSSARGDGEWTLPVTMTMGEVQTVFAAGMRADAHTGKDQYDEIALPHFMQFIDVSTRHPEFFAPHFATDIVPIQDSHSWTFYAQTNIDGVEATLTWEAANIAQVTGAFLLYDVTAQRVIDMKQTSSYSFVPGSGQTFRLVRAAGSDLRDPVVVLGRAYPNPFADVVRVAIWTEAPDSRVRLEIFNSMGQPLQSVASTFSEAGIHEMQWQSNNAVEVPAGLLFYRVEVNGQKSILRRMIKEH